MKSTTFLFIISSFLSFFASAQSTNQVSHTTGSQIVAGTNVSVTQSGCHDTLTTYCPSVTSPYIVGFEWSSTNAYCDGAYTFQFSPPLDSLTLNFSGITNTQDHKEILAIDINGNHYPIPSVGDSNNCDAFAVLDVNGNIAGCAGCIESGWSGTTIYGPISELRVRDSVLLGSPGGTVFSLYISDVSTVNLEENTSQQWLSFPNPFDNKLTISAQSNGLITLFDISGNEVFSRRIVAGKNNFQTQNIASGTYIVQLLPDSGSASYQKMIRE